MKKRLLSAALALAMALTLLPMSVFATIATPGTDDAKAKESAPASGYTTVQYVYGTDYSKLDKDNQPITNAWAWQWTDTAGTYGTPNKTYWASSTTLGGVVNGTNASGVWYANETDLVNTTPTTPTLRTSSFTLVGNIDLSSITAKPTSLSVNTFGHSLTLSSGVLNLLNSLTITDTFYTQYGGTRGTVSGLTRNVTPYTAPAAGPPATLSTSGLTLSITGAGVTDGISLIGRGNRVTLTDVAVTGDIVLSGATVVNNANGTQTNTYLGQSLTINPKAAAPYTKSVVSGAITVTGNSNTVALNGVTGTSGAATGAVAMTGVGGTLTASNGSILGAITVATGDDKTANPTLALTSAPATVTINDATVTSIGYTKAGDTYTGASTFTVNAQGAVTGAISTDNGTVNINSAKVSGAVTVKAGTLNVSGSNGTVGDITLGVSGTATKVNFNFSGTNYTVGDIDKADDATSLTIGSAWPVGRTNTFGEVDLGNYTGQGIKGGVFSTNADTPAKAAWFSPDLQFFRNNQAAGKFYYYGKQELATAIADAGAAAASDGIITVIGWNNGSNLKYAEFYNSMVDVGDKTKAVASLAYGASTAIYLPNMINGTPVSTWTDASTVNGGNGTAKTYGVNELVSLSSASTGVKLVIQSSGAAVTKLTNAAAADPNKNITVTLTNNQITLSGAVGQASFEDITVTCTTDLIGTDGKPVTFPVVVSFDTTTKAATISTLGIDPPPLGVVINTSNNTIQVGSNTYTLSVSGLTKPASNLQVAGITSGAYANTSSLTGKTIVATVSASMGNAAKQTLIDAITGSGAEFDWTASPAMQQVVNQAMTTITTNNQIENWATAAQRAAWNLDNKGKTPTESELYGTGYTTVVVEPYLAMNITAFSQSGTMTATLVPSYRVLVVSDNNNYAGTGGAGIAKNKTNFTAEGYYIAQQGRALGNPITDLTDDKGDNGVTIKFAASSKTATGFSASTVMHQDSTYAYKTTDGIAFVLTRAGKTGLGTVVFNTTEPLVELARAAAATNVINGKADATYYYDNLQAAVDDTLPQATEAVQDKITVTAAYTGSGTIDVTGTARIFKIETKGQTTITNANNNFTVGVDATGHNFTVQLQQSVAAATGEVEVAVGTANNGYATPNANKAKAGDKVTVSVVPNTGYQGAVTAKTNTGASVPVTNNGNNTFTFTVPAGATRVDVTPVFTASSTLPFTDVATTDSFYNAVKWNYDNKYIQGTTTTTFRPYNYLTRGQIVLILYRNAGSPTVNVSSYPYNDMPTYDAEMCRAIVWATNNKIVEGYGDGRFGPGLNVRNQEMAKILYEYNRYRGKTSTIPTVNLSTYFTDASSISSWAVSYVQWAVGNGVMGATSGKLFQPQLQLQRYQAAVDVYNYGLRFGA